MKRCADRNLRHGLFTALLLLLAGCSSGSYEGGTAAGGGNSGGGGGSFQNEEQFFNARVAPNLDFCRSCHVPNGIADTPEGERFMLSPKPAASPANTSASAVGAADDYARLNASWIALGRGVESNKLLIEPTVQSEPHSGGKPWPVTSDPYKNMKILLQCWNNPSGCAALLGNVGGGGGGGTNLPLLGSARGGHYWDSFCAGKPDDTALPADPRSLVQPGVSDGKAVAFNIFWQDCGRNAAPTNCGEHRAQVSRGHALIAGNGAIGAGHQFAGDASSSPFTTSATDYNSLWEKWGLASRPDNFDQLVEERYGMALSPERNPYPLPGEDPNATDGGSGQLPTALTQLRNPDGRWTGTLGVTCSVCHSGKVGSPADGPGLGAMYGTNSLHDLRLFTSEMSSGFGGATVGALSLNRVRGTGNITNFQLFAILEMTDLRTWAGSNPLLFVAPSTATEDPPVWWNLGHRPLKFFDAGLPTDATRIELSWYYPNAGIINTEAARAWVLAHEQDSTAWLGSLRSPAWPEAVLGSINTALAEQGAILFHNKNLWDPALNNPVRNPGAGNGSCAGCHGAYAPRYVNDPAYLANPSLEGVASFVTPIDVIGTDSRRLDGNNQSVSDSARSSWFAYRDQPHCGDQNDSALRGDRALGYLAPPLYGVWATAPYFHNGSVPNIWEVLKPADRKTIWRRVSKPAQPGVVMGFDTDLDRAYDAAKLGWMYDELACGGGALPYLDCTPVEAAADPIVQEALQNAYANGGALWNLTDPPILNDAQIEGRKIYNTNQYSQDNAGHEFTSVLTDQERRAIIEYLKTL